MTMKAMLQNIREFVLDTAFNTVHWDEGLCTGCLTCYEVCPVGCCRPDPAGKKILPPDQDACVVCGACVLQCPEGALALLGRRK